MANWTDINDQLPPIAGYYLVACAGGNVDKTFFHPTYDIFKVTYGDKSHYSRKWQGKNARYFDLSHKYGYKVMFWMDLPSAPDKALFDGEDL